MTWSQAPIVGDRQRPLVLVVGGGVIGITASHELLERGYAVTMVTRESAHDVTSTKFASPWAGAVWYPFSDVYQGRQSEWERATFAKWTAIKAATKANVAISSEVPIKIPDTVLSMVPLKRLERASSSHASSEDVVKKEEILPWWHSVVKDYKSSRGLTECRSFTLDTSSYLQLMHQALEDNPYFSMVTTEATSLVMACAFFGSTTTCVVNATGLGAAHLTDVLDESVEPIAGQLVRLRSTSTQADPTVLFVENDEADEAHEREAPNLDDDKDHEIIERLYMIPRAASGEVVVGGTEQYGCYSTTPSKSQTKRIIQGLLKNHSGIRIENLKDVGINEADHVAHEHTNQPKETYKIIGASLGLRPGRRGGPRLELDPRGITTSLIKEHESCDSEMRTPRSSQSSNGSASHGPARDAPITAPFSRGAKEKIPIVHAYGFGKTGYQASWGAAKEIADLVDSQVRPLAA